MSRDKIEVSKRIAVIGLGNTLRRDDGIGIAVLESLLTSYKREGVDYFNFGIASFDLLHRMENYQAVLLVDAVNAGLACGECKIFALEEIDCNLQEDSPLSSHELDLRSIFELYKKLDFKTRVYVAGIQAGDVSFGQGLSEALKNKQTELVEKISLFIDQQLR